MIDSPHLIPEATAGRSQDDRPQLEKRLHGLIKQAYRRAIGFGTSARIVALILRDGSCCQLCGRDLLAAPESLLDATVDHLEPRSKGGTNALDNCILACYHCNLIKRSDSYGSLEAARESIQSRRRRLLPELAKPLAELRAIAPAGM